MHQGPQYLPPRISLKVLLHKPRVAQTVSNKGISKSNYEILNQTTAKFGVQLASLKIFKYHIS